VSRILTRKASKIGMRNAMGGIFNRGGREGCTENTENKKNCLKLCGLSAFCASSVLTTQKEGDIHLKHSPAVFPMF